MLHTWSVTTREGDELPFTTRWWHVLVNDQHVCYDGLDLVWIDKDDSECTDGPRLSCDDDPGFNFYLVSVSIPTRYM